MNGEYQGSYVEWVFSVLAPVDCLLFLAAGACGFVMTLLMVRRGKGDKPSIGILLCIGPSHCWWDCKQRYMA